MLKVVKGDLLKSNCTVIAHQANCYGDMSGGIAAQIAKEYEALYLNEQQNNTPAGTKYGNYSGILQGNKMVINLYGQTHPGAAKNSIESMEWMLALESSLDKLLTDLESGRDYYEKVLGKIKVGLPYEIGCGIAGGDWQSYKSMLESVSLSHDIDIYLYKLK